MPRLGIWCLFLIGVLDWERAPQARRNVFLLVWHRPARFRGRPSTGKTRNGQAVSPPTPRAAGQYFFDHTPDSETIPNSTPSRFP